tara:strand:- start:8074 stop:8841 length:768 start_codon:yes stop_codon:yes gene_type:complete
VSILDLFSLDGKTALVVGGGRGIGASLARALAEAGAHVAVADIDRSTAGETAETLRVAGGDSLAMQVDVTSGTEADRIVNEVVSAWGKLDIAVNSAGISIQSRAEEMTEEVWDRVVNVNLKGIYACTRAEGEAMLAAGTGSIVNVASISGQIVNRPQRHAQYNAAKAGVIQYSRTCAAEWADRGVRVNTISPGHTVSPMTAPTVDEMEPTWVSNTPMGRLGQPEDLQGAVVYLASAASSYVTGHDLVVDGGYTIW